MKTVCLYFQVHQPWRLKKYRFFNMGKDHNYLDDLMNRSIMQKVARQCYLPMNALLLKLIRENKGKFRCSFSITGIAIEQFRAFAPEVLDSFKELAATGCVEFLAETYSHSLASLASKEDFTEQVKLHTNLIKKEFGVKPTAFRNTELIYSDEIGAMVAGMGFRTMLAEGAKHVLGWKSPNYVYSAASCPKLKLLLKNSKLSDDIAFRFSNTEWDGYPMTADKYIDWIASTPAEEQIINLFMNLETFGELQPASSGIFQFLEALPRFARERGVEFMTPSEAVKTFKPVDVLSVVHPISWADEARDTSAWLGNQLQNEAFRKLYSVAERVRLSNDRPLKLDWGRLQASDHLFYMSTKHMADGAVHSMFSPYETPYQAFTNYMNVLADFIVRVEEQYPMSIENEELNSLLTTIRNQAREIETLNKEITAYRLNEEHLNEEHLLRQRAEAKPEPKAEKTPKAKTEKAPKATVKAEKAPKAASKAAEPKAKKTTKATK